MSNEAPEAGDVVDAPVADAPASDAPAPTDAPTEAPASETPSFEWSDVRTALVGEDAAMEKVVGRYRSLDAFGKAFMAQRQKLSERAPELPTLGENPSDEEVAAYREAYGIPADVAGYEVTFGEEFDHTEADAGILDGFKASMHESNVPPAAAQAANGFAGTRATAQNTVTPTRLKRPDSRFAVHQCARDRFARRQHLPR